MEDIILEIGPEIAEEQISAQMFFETQTTQEAEYVATSSENDEDADLMGTTNVTSQQSFVQCKECFKTFPEKNNFYKHRMKHEVPERPFVCKICGESFTVFSCLIMHKRSTHPGEETYRPRRLHQDLMYKCMHCNKSYDDEEKFNRHTLFHTGGRPHECQECGKKFAFEDTLKRHLNEHQKPYRCETCGKSYSMEKWLIVHQRFHNGEKTYKCRKCGSHFETMLEYQRHKSAAHKEFKCDLCDKQFGTSAKLIYHRRAHTGEKPFQCDQCLRTFRTIKSCRSHMATHMKERRHKCDLCDKSYYDLQDLRDHKLAHTGERPHTCDICGKGFTRQKNLRAHTKTHFGTQVRKKPKAKIVRKEQEEWSSDKNF